MSTRRSMPRSWCAALLAGLVALLVPLALTTSAGATVTASVTGTELAVASDASDPITVGCAAMSRSTASIRSADLRRVHR